MVPCTPYGCLLLLQDRLGDLSGKDAIVVGRSILVGKPMGQLLLGANCTVTMAHSRTRALPDQVRRADICVPAVGRAGMVTGDWDTHREMGQDAGEGQRGMTVEN